MIGAAVLVLAGAGGGFMVMRSRAAHAEKPAAEQKLPVAFMDVREMNVNLMPEPGQTQPRFVRLKVALEVRDSKVAAEVQPLMPRVEDTFQVFVRELRVGDFEAAGGTYRLREELLRRVNVAVYPPRSTRCSSRTSSSSRPHSQDLVLPWPDPTTRSTTTTGPPL